MRDALPFGLALFFLVAQPFLDEVWLQRYQQEIDPDDVEGLRVSAKWVADVAQFLPSASLTVVGVALLIPEDASNTNVVAFVAVSLLILIVLFAGVGTRGRPARKHVFPFSALQIVLLLLNTSGLAYTCTR